MGLASKGWTFQVKLKEAKTAQEVDVPPREPETKSIVVKAAAANKGALFVGFSKKEVEAEAKVSGAGFELAAGESISLDITGPGTMWFNGANAEDKLCILGLVP